jgi:hypothetical protein
MRPRTVATGLVYVVSVVALAVFGRGGAAKLEVMFRPIIGGSVVSDVVADDKRICWSWTWHKLRAAPLVSMRYYLQTPSSAPLPVSVVRKDGPLSYAERPVGPGNVDLCVALPAGVTPKSEIVLTGYVEYQPSHDYWTVRQELPTIRWVPPGVSARIRDDIWR